MDRASQDNVLDSVFIFERLFAPFFAEDCEYRLGLDDGPNEIDNMIRIGLLFQVLIEELNLTHEYKCTVPPAINDYTKDFESQEKLEFMSETVTDALDDIDSIIRKVRYETDKPDSTLTEIQNDITISHIMQACYLLPKRSVK